MQTTKVVAGTHLEADVETIVRTITQFDPSRHKGQAGKIAIIGGCHEYTGAPYFAAISALKIGADLSHVFCTKDAATVIKSYSPEIIVHPVLEESYSIKEDEKRSIFAKVLAKVSKWMERFDCLVVGPGLGRDPFLLDCVSEIMKLARQSEIPIVVDGDGLFLVTNNLDLVSGYHLAVLTPNVNEYKRLVQKVLNCEVSVEDATEELLSLARRCMILLTLEMYEISFTPSKITKTNKTKTGFTNRVWILSRVLRKGFEKESRNKEEPLI